MTKYASDKGNSWHNYTTVYNKLFDSMRGRVRRIFEVGLGRDHPAMAATIGKDGRPGASLRGWREIFPNALVFGADIDRNLLFEEERIQTYYCDQLDPQAISELWAQTATSADMDVIVEDGLHTFDGNVSFLTGSIHKVRPGGYYCVEDIKGDDLPSWYNQLPRLAEKYPECDFAIVELPSTFNRYDNNMVVAQKRVV